jgi:tyrosine-protein kinase Etk/Wzc
MNPGTANSQPNDEIGLLDILIFVAKHKALLIAATSVGTVLSVIIALLMPNVYTGSAKVMPPQQSQSMAAVLVGQLGGLANVAGNSLGIKNPNDLYVGILKSRTIADNIIRQFQLQEIYGTPTMVETRKVLSDHTNISSGKDGLITIEFDDREPARAASVANAYIEELDKLTQSLAVTEAGQRRLLFERQLKQAKDDLASAEIAMKITQEKTGLIKLDDQGKAIIEAVATLRAQISAKEVELRTMRTFATDQNIEYVRAHQQLVGLRDELNKLERAKMVGGGDVLLPTGKVPEAGLEYLRRFRDVKYYETVFELLARQFELAKIDEAKDAAIIQTVDRAIPPDRKSKPKRALIVIAATIAAGLLAVLWALLRDFRERAQSDATTAARLERLRRHISFR